MSATAFLFPGQASQAVGMGKDLSEDFPLARQVFEEADDTVASTVQWKSCRRRV